VTLLTFNDANVTGNYTVLHAKFRAIPRSVSARALEGGVQVVR